MATTNKIRLTNEKETLFIPLYGKAIDYRSKNTILNDHTANDIVEKAGIDFTSHKRAGSRILAVRAKQYDEWAKAFITKNKSAVVLHLGCGLDARITRVEPPPSVSWFDVDYPEVIRLRKEFYQETSEYKMMAASITTPNWLAAIPGDKPVLIIAEGVFEYLSEEEVAILLRRLTDHFSQGQIAFDVMNSSAKHSGDKNLEKTTHATGVLRWAVDKLDEVDKLNPRLKRVEVVPLLKSVFIKELPFAFRFILYLLRLFPKKRNAMRLLRYDF